MSTHRRRVYLQWLLGNDGAEEVLKLEDPYPDEEVQPNPKRKRTRKGKRWQKPN